MSTVVQRTSTNAVHRIAVVSGRGPCPPSVQQRRTPHEDSTSSLCFRQGVHQLSRVNFLVRHSATAGPIHCGYNHSIQRDGFHYGNFPSTITTSNDRDDAVLFCVLLSEQQWQGLAFVRAELVSCKSHFEFPPWDSRGTHSYGHAKGQSQGTDRALSRHKVWLSSYAAVHLLVNWLSLSVIISVTIQKHTVFTLLLLSRNHNVNVYTWFPRLRKFCMKTIDRRWHLHRSLLGTWMLTGGFYVWVIFLSTATV